MSSTDFTPGPRQQFRSPLGTPQGVPGPLAAPPVEPPPGLDLGLPPELAGALPPAGGDDEITILKAMIVAARDYTDIPTVEESERLEMEKVTTILQKLLADNQRMADQATGTGAANRKLLGGP